MGKLKHCVWITCVHLEDLRYLLVNFPGLIFHYLVSKINKKKTNICCLLANVVCDLSYSLKISFACIYIVLSSTQPGSLSYHGCEL